MKGVPVVLIVVQATDTLDMMTAAAKLGSPLLCSLILAAPQRRAQYCQGGIERVNDPAFNGSESKLEALKLMDEAREVLSSPSFGLPTTTRTSRCRPHCFAAFSELDVLQLRKDRREAQDEVCYPVGGRQWYVEAHR